MNVMWPMTIYNTVNVAILLLKLDVLIPSLIYLANCMFFLYNFIKVPWS